MFKPESKKGFVRCKMSIIAAGAEHKSIKHIKGVGEAGLRKLTKIGIFTVADVLTYYPRAYEDRTKIKRIADLMDNEECSVKAHIVQSLSETRPRRNLRILKTTVSDGSGKLVLTWFNQPYIKNKLNKDTEYIFYGKIKKNGIHAEMMNPVIERTEQLGNNIGRILPVYSLTKGITQTYLRNLVGNALTLCRGQFHETLPECLKKEYDLCSIDFAYEEIHFPKSFSNMERARKRLVFEELLVMQLCLGNIRYINTKEKGIKFKPVNMSPLLDELTFSITPAQKKVFDEISTDMESDRRMNRLIQGDVGSGKTIIAAMALYKAVKNGFQGAFMVPTEILAEQHFRSFNAVFKKLGISVELLTGGMKKKDKDEIKARCQDGKVDIVIGTHAILEDDMFFSKLGLVVTDEQHRFGVSQRARLSQKGACPDLLVMTATPIPRTLMLALYGDLDVSVIDALPPNRKPVKTYAVSAAMRDRVYDFIRKNVFEGRQAYIVCPLVDDSDEIEAMSALTLAESLKAKQLSDLRVGIIHGKMKSGQKEDTFKKFFEGQLDVLVSTTVIEVGMNVPNATVIVVENAERFGLAQLHQLRGRVGRGKFQSYCILINQNQNSLSKKRMEIMVNSNDGFVIAEEDLKLRGPGDIFGVRQHGLPEFKIANLYRDIDILKDVQEAVKRIIKNRLLLENEEYAALKDKLDRIYSEKFNNISMN
jgi:ATP-dependent DNA helicase RecG